MGHQKCQKSTLHTFGLLSIPLLSLWSQHIISSLGAFESLDTKFLLHLWRNWLLFFNCKVRNNTYNITITSKSFLCYLHATCTHFSRHVLIRRRDLDIMPLLLVNFRLLKFIYVIYIFKFGFDKGTHIIIWQWMQEVNLTS